jgi:hypothetical protein
LEEKI